MSYTQCLSIDVACKRHEEELYQVKQVVSVAEKGRFSRFHSSKTSRHKKFTTQDMRNSHLIPDTKTHLHQMGTPINTAKNGAARLQEHYFLPVIQT